MIRKIIVSLCVESPDCRVTDENQVQDNKPPTSWSARETRCGLGDPRGSRGEFGGVDCSASISPESECCESGAGPGSMACGEGDNKPPMSCSP